MIWKKIKTAIPRLSSFHYEEIKKMYEEKSNSINLRSDAEDYLKYEKFTDQMLEMAKSLNAYHKNKPLLFLEKKIGIWTKDEEEFLKKIMEARAGKPDYPLLATCFPGRSGSKVYSHYRYMMSGKDIDPLDDSSTPKYHFNFDPHK